MKSLTDQLSQYAEYHRDPRNIATHFVGVPMIVVAVAMLIARPSMTLSGLTLSPAVAFATLTTLFYLRLDLRYGAVMGLSLAGAVSTAHTAAALPTANWLTLGIGLFVVGWIIQFVGHHYEGRKPAFVDDLVGLIVGPLFVVAEAGFLLGFRSEVKAAVEARTGRVHRRDAVATAQG